MTSISHQAARWFTRLLELPAEHPERERFATWLAADPRHTTEYQAFAELWEDFSQTTQTRALAGAMEQMHRRRFLGGSVLGLLAMAGLGGWLGFERFVGRTRQFATGIAEQLSVALDDGSELVLDADSQVHVRYSGRERYLVLLRGRAIFEVRRDKRPFVVEAGLAQIRVLGTRFAVERVAGQVQVSVERGRVEVRSDTASTVLEAGQVLRCDDQGQLQPLTRSASGAFSFVRGNLTFEGASLTEVAAVLSRYRRVPLKVQGTSSRRLSAVVQLGDVERFVDTLPALAQATVLRHQDVTWLVPR